MLIIKTKKSKLGGEDHQYLKKTGAEVELILSTCLALKMYDGLQSLHYGLKYIGEIGSFWNEWREAAYVNACLHNG